MPGLSAKHLNLALLEPVPYYIPMWIFYRRIPHLTRYFFLIALSALACYAMNRQLDIALVLLGPAIYLAHWLKLGLNYAGYFAQGWDNLVYLIPTTAAYFCIAGFLLKKLWNERGAARFVTLFALVFFILYLHYAAWSNFQEYFSLPPPPVSAQ